MKKFLALMALLLCFMVLFVACDNNNEPEPSEVPTDPIVEPAGCEHAYDNACDADCNLCGEKRATAAHVEETLAAVAPTCTKAGLTEGKVCTVCGVVTKAQAVAPATGHTEVTVPGTAATCTTSGLTDGTACSVCKAVVKAQEVISATGHKEVKNQSVAPTCTTPGYVGATVCGVCGEVLEGKVTEKALGHAVVDIPEVPSTCTTQGTAGGKMCSRCEVVLIEPELQKLANHTVKKVAGYAPTCTTAGLEDGSVCKDCGKVIKAQKIIPATHGELEVIPAVDPTCTELGYTEGSKCSDCGAIVVAQEVLPYEHTYTYACDTHCAICNDQRWDEPHHEMGFTKSGALGCIHGCGTYYNDVAVDPATFTSGADLGYRVTVLGKDIATSSLITYNEEEGYVSISGMTGVPADPGTDRIVPVMYGPAFDGEGASVAQRYLVMRYRTDTAEAELRFVIWGEPTTMSVNSNLGTGGEWKTVVIDLLQSTDQHQRFDIRCNIYANQTDFSHFASFDNLEDATAYAINLSNFVDNKCPHYAYELAWDGTPMCSICYESVKPTTSHEGSDLYNAVDPTSPDFSLVTDNGYKGVTITGIGTSVDGQSANLKLLSDVPFGQYAVIVYEFPALPSGVAYFGFCVDGQLVQHYKPATTTSGVFYFGNLENNKQIEGAGPPTGLNAGKNTYLDLVCNFAGLTEWTRIKAIYTFDTAIEAQLYAEHVVAKKCFHDNTTLNVETGHNVCDACGTIQGATPEWPLDLESGFVTTPTFVLGASLMDPGVQEFHYSYYAENDHILVLDYYGTNIMISVNGNMKFDENYDPAHSADIKAGDLVEVSVQMPFDENWNPVTDPFFFIVDKAVPGSANNPFELVLGETTTPEFILGTGFDNPGVQQYFYKWVAIDDGKLILPELDNISWTNNGNWGEGYTVEVLKGDVVEITIFMGMDGEYNWVTTPVTFSAEFDVVHRMAVNEDGSITCNKDCHSYVPATYSAGQTLADFAAPGNYGNHGVYNAEGGYVTITGESKAGDPGTDKVYNITNGAKERYVVLRYRTTDPVVTFRFVHYDFAAGAEKWVDLGSSGEWQTVVVDAGANYAGWMEFRCNIYAKNEDGSYMHGAPSSDNVQTDISHIVTFKTIEEAQAYAGFLAYQLDGVCPHDKIETGFDAIGSVRCTVCGFVSTPATYQAMDSLYDAVVIANSDSVTDSGAAGIAVTSDKRTGFAYSNLGDTVRVQLTSEATYGKYIVVVYNSNYAGGFLALGNGDNSKASMNFADGMIASTGYRTYYYPGTTFEGNTLDLLLHFGDGNAETTTNILGVATFNTKEEAQLFVAYMNAVLAG